MTNDIFAKCPECQRPINVSERIRAHQSDSGQTVLPSDIYFSVYCSHCAAWTLALFFQSEKTVNKQAKSTLFELLVEDIKRDRKPPQTD
jgi:hypothetical protein